MDRNGLRSSQPWWWLALAAMLVWWPVLFGGRTIARSEFATTHHPEAVEARAGWPVNDSLASARQDEAWLVLIRRSLATGSIPLVNLHNGLGAPLLESLQPGVLYPLNVLLLAFDPASPWMFDAFSLIHVGVLLVGLAVLFRRDVRLPLAVPLAILFGLAGATYQNVNMVHYRGFVWLPWMLASVRGLCEDSPRARITNALLLVAVTLCSLTAGNLQDAAMSLAVVALLVIVDLLAVRREAGHLEANAGWRWAGLLTGLVLLGGPVVLPHALAVANGDLATVAAPDRIAEGVPPTWMLTWILPHLLGNFPHQLFERDFWYLPQSDFTTPGLFLVLFGGLATSRMASLRDRWRARTCVILIVVGLLKTIDTPLFNWLAGWPVVGGLKFHKYNLFLVPVAGMLASQGLKLWLETLETHTGDNRTAVLNRLGQRSLWIVGLLVAGVLIFVWRDKSWRLSHAPNPAVARFAFLSIVASITATLATAWVLRKGGAFLACRLLVLWTAHALVQFPGGWLPRAECYEDPLTGLATNPQASLSWDQRLLVTPTCPNSNLLFGRSELGVFDPVLNRRFRSFFLRHFDPLYADFALFQATRPRPEQDSALRIAGVSEVLPIRTLLSGDAPRPNPFWSEPARLVPESSMATVEAELGPTGTGTLQSTRPVLEELARRVTARTLSPNTVACDFTIPQSLTEDLRLVVRLAYSHAWHAVVRIEGDHPTESVQQAVAVEPVADLFCSVRVPRSSVSEANKPPPRRVQIRLSYWPPGLTLGLCLLPLGIALVLGCGAGGSATTRSTPVPVYETVTAGARPGVFELAACGALLIGTACAAPGLRPCEIPARLTHSEQSRFAEKLAAPETRPPPGWSFRLESLDGEAADALVSVKRPAGSQRPILARGWIVYAPSPGPVSEICIQIGNTLWNATPGLIREDRPAEFADSSFRLCGFLAPLPPEAIPDEPAPVRLWARLNDSTEWIPLGTSTRVQRTTP